jgi:hypothetical protein
MQDTKRNVINLEIPPVHQGENLYDYLHRIDPGYKIAIKTSIKELLNLNDEQLKNRLLRRTPWHILQIKAINHLLQAKVLKYDNK